MNVASVVMTSLLITALASCANSDGPRSWDCGSGCVAECAFLNPEEHGECIDGCSSCDGKDSLVFAAPPDLSPPIWVTDKRIDAGWD